MGLETIEYPETPSIPLGLEIITSDIIVLKSDVLLTKGGSDVVTNTSDVVVLKSDILVNSSDLVVETTLSVYTTDDSEDNAMLKTHAYKAVTNGFVAAKCIMATNGNTLAGYVGSTNDPFGAGYFSIYQGADKNGSYKSIFFAVAKDAYFEIRTAAEDTPVIYWQSKGTLSKPIDQD